MSEEIQFEQMVEKVKAALAGAGTSSGGTMLPTETIEEIIQLVYSRNYIRGLVSALPMSRQTVEVPKLTGSVSYHGMSLSSVESGTAATETSQTTGQITMTLKTLIANIPIGNYLVAYGVEGLLNVLRDDIATRLAFVEEQMFLNGDIVITTAYADNLNGAYNASTNVLGVNATTNDYLLQFDGLLKSAGATAVDGAGAVLTLAKIREAMVNLAVYGDNRDSLALIVPRVVEAQLLGTTELQTVDKYGPGATILNGELGRIYGIRVFASNALRTDFNASGVFDGTTTNLTVALLFNTRSPLIGNPTVASRRFSIGFEDEPTKDRFVLIPREDIAFGVRYTEAICKIYNLSTA